MEPVVKESQDGKFSLAQTPFPCRSARSPARRVFTLGIGFHTCWSMKTTHLQAEQFMMESQPTCSVPGSASVEIQGEEGRG